MTKPRLESEKKMLTNLIHVPIDRDGTPRGFRGALPEMAREVLDITTDLYDELGFEEPWISYLAIIDDRPVGACAFKGPPSDGRVEIAYFTFPEFEGNGIATAMASMLVERALEADADVVVAAQTLPDRNASHRILEKLGFRHVDTLLDEEDGIVWEWRLTMGLEKESARLARAWIQGWIDGKPDDIPLAPDFVHTSPYGTVEGRERYLEWVKPLAAENVAKLEIVKILSGEREAVVWFEMTSPDGVVPSCDWVEVEGGEIKRITSFYDASVLRKEDGTL